MRNIFSRYRIWIIVALIISVWPLFLKSDLVLSLLSQMGIAVIFALSYNILLGQCGLLSFGHALFSGLGAYFTIHAMGLINNGQLNIPTPLLPLIGAFVGLVLGIIVGLIATRKPGATFALITLGINELLHSSALMFIDFFGSETGISAKREGWLRFTFGSQIEVYYLILFWTFLCIVLILLFNHTPLGKISNAVRDNPERTGFIGYNPVKVRALLVMISGFFAGLAGGLYAINWELVTYENVGLMQSALVLFTVFIGGVGYFFGPIIGAVIVTFIIFYLSAFTGAWMLYLGLFFILMVLFAPSGIAGILMLHQRVFQRKLLRKLIPSYIATLFPFLMFTISGICLIEIIFRWSSTGYTNSIITIFGITFNAAGSLPWVITFAGLFLGGYFFKRSLSKVKKSWNLVLIQLESKMAHDYSN
jgi:branched-chain amino acid transport system permease protein